jgi:hypothetical protein
VDLINEVQSTIVKYANGEIVDSAEIFQYKERTHKKQVYALFAINAVCQKLIGA